MKGGGQGRKNGAKAGAGGKMTGLGALSSTSSPPGKFTLPQLSPTPPKRSQQASPFGGIGPDINAAAAIKQQVIHDVSAIDAAIANLERELTGDQPPPPPPPAQGKGRKPAAAAGGGGGGKKNSKKR